MVRLELLFDVIRLTINALVSQENMKLDFVHNLSKCTLVFNFFFS